LKFGETQWLVPQEERTYPNIQIQTVSKNKDYMRKDPRGVHHGVCKSWKFKHSLLFKDMAPQNV
jgi:hypothetical protein